MDLEQLMIKIKPSFANSLSQIRCLRHQTFFLKRCKQLLEVWLRGVFIGRSLVFVSTCRQSGVQNDLTDGQGMTSQTEEKRRGSERFHHNNIGCFFIELFSHHVSKRVVLLLMDVFAHWPHQFFHL